MTIAAILAGVLQHSSVLQQGSRAQGAGAFQLLGQDLQSGNLKAAQSDFAALIKNFPFSQTGATSQLSQAFSNLSQDLKSGNIAAAQQDFSAIQQDLQQFSSQLHPHHHHHHAINSGNGGSGQQNFTVAEELGALGQALQSGNLASAQQAYATLQSSLQQSAGNFGSTTGNSGSTQSSGAPLSVSA